MLPWTTPSIPGTQGARLPKASGGTEMVQGGTSGWVTQQASSTLLRTPRCEGESRWEGPATRLGTDTARALSTASPSLLQLVWHAPLLLCPPHPWPPSRHSQSLIPRTGWGRRQSPVGLTATSQVKPGSPSSPSGLMTRGQIAGVPSGSVSLLAGGRDGRCPHPTRWAHHSPAQARCGLVSVLPGASGSPPGSR